MAAVEKSNQEYLDFRNGKVMYHYVAFVQVNGKLYELDSQKKGPIRHCNTMQMYLLKDACELVEHFKKRDPHVMGYSILVLAKRDTPIALIIIHY
jgi:Ubiquitin carboxyl-terminal hydrolase, family 1